MTRKWPLVRLGEIVNIKHGWPFKSEFFSEDLCGEPIVVGIGNYQYTGGFRFDSTRLKEYRSEYPPEYELKPGDILLVMTCQTPGGEILGLPGKIPADGRLYLHNQRLGKPVLRDGAPVHLDFLYWVFLSKQFNRYLYQGASGTKILHTSPGRIEDYSFALPSLPEQRRICDILDQLDKKIELNRKTNQTLEAIAEALFTSWFVDLDPVGGGVAVGTAADTSALVANRLKGEPSGKVPEGWHHGLLEEHVDLERGLSYKGEYLTDTGAPMINLKCIRPGGGFHREGLKGYSGPSKDKHQVSAGEIVIANTDITQAREVLGAPARVPRFLGARTLFSHHVSAVRRRPGSPLGPHFLFQLLRTAKFRERAGGFAMGTTVLALPKEAVLKTEFVLPPEALLARFEGSAAALFERIDCNEEESLSLAALRDTLLPELLAGGLRLEDAESTLAANT